MKVSYKHLVNFIPSNPTIDDISQKLFQLGHEHDIQDYIFDMEFTPNRGDCISVIGLLRDLSVFYEINLPDQIYDKALRPFNINFINNAQEACPYISFLKVDIEDDIKSYGGLLKDYFNDFQINKNNFFTDISNYILYETGQPTHCYDAKKIKNSLSLEIVHDNIEFETLLEKKIQLTDENIVFTRDGDSIVNLAGVVGGMNTSCSSNTKSVIIECAYFNPENIIGKSLKYDIKSDAAYKFERRVDPLCHEKVLRRFLKIIEDHAIISKAEIFKKNYKEYVPVKIPYCLDKVNKILGITLDKKTFNNYLAKLDFDITNTTIIPPSFRGDVHTENDIAEEIARVIGYNNIPIQVFDIPKLDPIKNNKLIELKLKNHLIENGFFEVINNPFIPDNKEHSINIDNPLDSSKKYIRTNLEKSLIDNLIYNEKRQQDSIKLFEVSDIYFMKKNEIQSKKILGIICSGRVGKDYLNFSKKINTKYLKNILEEACPENNFQPKIVDRNNLESKLNNEIVYIEIEIANIKSFNNDCLNLHKEKTNKSSFIKYKPISQFPKSIRDLSFAVKDVKKYYELQDFLLSYKDELIKEIYIFDFYNNINKDEIKIGFRFIFQSRNSTVTESDVTKIMDKIIDETLAIDSVYIPGMKN